MVLMSKLIRSWVASANGHSAGFPPNNLPYGVVLINGAAGRCGIAIGDYILDVHQL
jgi:fumarylacetoacetase